jgi:hypothetical protein
VAKDSRFCVWRRALALSRNRWYAPCSEARLTDQRKNTYGGRIDTYSFCPYCGKPLRKEGQQMDIERDAPEAA